MMITEEIKLRIHEESDLFSPLDPDQQILSEDVISYLHTKYRMMYLKYQTKSGNYVLHIFSDTPVNEAHVKDAIRGHFLHEKDNIRFLSKIETHKMHALGILGLLFLSASYVAVALQGRRVCRGFDDYRLGCDLGSNRRCHFKTPGALP